MVERPILMSGPMVRACLRCENPKRQTRRVVKPQPPAWISHFGFTAFTPPGSVSGRGVHGAAGPAEKFFRSPYGLAGDRLWVRETFAARADVDPGADRDKALHYLRYRADHDGDLGDEWHAYGMWRPSIHMPRWASRITLEITHVLVERLQSISADDARFEGLSQVTKDDGRTWKWGIPDRDGWPGTDDDGWPWADWDVSPVRAYARLWDRISGREHGWDANPWVWVIVFRRVAD